MTDIAIHDPWFLLSDPSRNFNGYTIEFIRQVRPLLYVSQRSRVPLILAGLYRYGFRPRDIRLTSSFRKVNSSCDVLVNFNGRPDLGTVPAAFQGMKAVHVMDYVFRAAEADAALRAAGVDYVLGYADHASLCPFFAAAYSSFAGRVIPVPFGFGSRFTHDVEFADRVPRVIVAGAVNPVNDGLAAPGDLTDYEGFWRGREEWTHRWRRRLSENETVLDDIMDSLLPKFPQTKNNAYDAVATMNRYMLFANDEGLMAFPPARTYEGVAAGAIMVAGRHACWDALGFEHGLNCLLHEPLSVDDFRRTITCALSDCEALAVIAARGTQMVRERYSHRAVAAALHNDLIERAQMT